MRVGGSSNLGRLLGEIRAGGSCNHPKLFGNGPGGARIAQSGVVTRRDPAATHPQLGTRAE